MVGEINPQPESKFTLKLFESLYKTIVTSYMFLGTQFDFNVKTEFFFLCLIATKFTSFVDSWELKAHLWVFPQALWVPCLISLD